MLAVQPFRLEPLPAIGHHGVGPGVRIRAATELASQQLGGPNGHGLADPLPMVEDRRRPLAVENGFERLTRGFGGNVSFRLGRGSFFFRGCGGRFFFRGRVVRVRHALSVGVRVTLRDIGALTTLASGISLTFAGGASVHFAIGSLHGSAKLFSGAASGNHRVNDSGGKAHATDAPCWNARKEMIPSRTVAWSAPNMREMAAIE